MGVPSYFRWLTTRYEKEIIHSILPRDRIAGSVVLYLDFNGAIHPAVRSNPDMKYADMNAAVCTYLENILSYVRPDEVYIAIDGVAPAAKMNQQRDRRYKSAKETHFMRVLNHKYGQVNRAEPVDFNMISPGTEFMYDLQNSLEEYIHDKQKDKSNPIWGGLKRVTLNGSNQPGEGEHKIMAELRLRKDLPEHPVVYGLDADLIFLSLLNQPKITLLRENSFFGSDAAPDKTAYSYLDITVLHKILIRILQPTTNLTTCAEMGVKNLVGREPVEKDTQNNDPERLLIDYAFICFLMGNDFLPRLPSLRIRDNSLSDVIVFYKITAWNLGSYLVSPDLDINYDFFYEFLTEIAHVENEVLVQQAIQREKNIRRQLEKVKRLSPYEAEKERNNYVEDKYVDDILPGTPGWRVRYYAEHVNIRYVTAEMFQSDIFKVCKNYIEGMVWVLRYYLKGPPNWDWLYYYKVAPSAQDLRDFLNSTDDQPITFQPSEPVSPYVQLMSILPPDSAKLLPETLRHLMTDKDSKIHYMYPIEFKLTYHGNKFLHECPPSLPFIDRELLTRIVELNSMDYSEKEKLRNTIF
jgi:5'-3' exonuclease